MKSEHIQNFKKLFETQRQSLVTAIQWTDHEYTIRSEDLSDEVDLTAVELEQGMRLRLKQRELVFLRKIDQALERIQQGTFGFCESCEEPIEESRLKARPTASMCISCKEQEERMEKRTNPFSVLRTA